MGLSNEAPGAGASGAGPARQDASASHADPWSARLALSFALRHGKTTLVHAEHFGPLRVQRPFYPEANGTCHVYVLHPPGGVASGDELQVKVEVGAAASALLTTPGATKLYRSRGVAASIHQELAVAGGGRLEWLPQETIVFDGAEAELVTEVKLAQDAVYAGWEILCLGRPACGETLTRGRLKTTLRVHVDGCLRFVERGDFVGGDSVLSEAWGLGGMPVFGLFVVVDPSSDDDWVEHVRAEVVAQAGLFSITRASGILLARYRGESTLDARCTFERMFEALRPLYARSRAVTPRIWRT